MSTKPRPTHRLEFNVMHLMDKVSCGYQIASTPSCTPGETGVQRIGATLLIVTDVDTPQWEVVPWLITDPLKVSVFCRRQDQVEHTHVMRLKGILEALQIPHKYKSLG